MPNSGVPNGAAEGFGARTFPQPRDHTAMTSRPPTNIRRWTLYMRDRIAREELREELACARARTRMWRQKKPERAGRNTVKDVKESAADGADQPTKT